MAATEEPVNLRPVFCHRDDCDARRDRAFCSACGADIAAYMTSVTGEFQSITEQLRVAEHPVVPVSITKAPPVETGRFDRGGNGAEPGPGDDDPGPPAPRRRVWSHPFVVGAFGASVALGAGAGALAGLV